MHTGEHDGAGEMEGGREREREGRCVGKDMESEERETEAKKNGKTVREGQRREMSGGPV